MDKPEALRLADALDNPGVDFACSEVATELRRLHAENERLSATVKAREDEILTHSEAFYEATRLLSEEREKNERLAAALASSCDEQRHELWESGGVAGCERARAAERQRDALLEALKTYGWHAEDCPQYPTWTRPEKWPDCTCGFDAAIAAAEGEQK